MKIAVRFAVLLLVGVSMTYIRGFAPHIPSRSASVSTELNMASVGMRSSGIRTTINQLTAANFSASLAKIEPLLLQDAGITLYRKSMRRIKNKARALGMTMPPEYAREAKATEKRRLKQEEYIKAKQPSEEAAPEVVEA